MSLLRFNNVNKNGNARGLLTPAQPGENRFHSTGSARGKRMLTQIREILAMQSTKSNSRFHTRFEDVADAYVQKMEEGSFIHTNAIIEREEGKVPTRLADADGKSLKLYAGLPVDDEPGAP